MNIEDIQGALLSDRFRTSGHAHEEIEDDEITEDELASSVSDGEITEKYLDDKPLPSCLICGITPAGDPVHSVWGYNAREHYAVLITAYRPDPSRWVDWRISR